MEAKPLRVGMRGPDAPHSSPRSSWPNQGQQMAEERGETAQSGWEQKDWGILSTLDGSACFNHSSRSRGSKQEQPFSTPYASADLDSVPLRDAGLTMPQLFSYPCTSTTGGSGVTKSSFRAVKANSSTGTWFQPITATPWRLQFQSSNPSTPRAAYYSLRPGLRSQPPDVAEGPPLRSLAEGQHLLSIAQGGGGIVSGSTQRMVSIPLMPVVMRSSALDGATAFVTTKSTTVPGGRGMSAGRSSGALPGVGTQSPAPPPNRPLLASVGLPQQRFEASSELAQELSKASGGAAGVEQQSQHTLFRMRSAPFDWGWHTPGAGARSPLIPSSPCLSVY